MEDDVDAHGHLNFQSSWVLRDVDGAPQRTTRATREPVLSQTGFAAGDSRMYIDLDHAWECSGRDRIEVTMVKRKDHEVLGGGRTRTKCMPKDLGPCRNLDLCEYRKGVAQAPRSIPSTFRQRLLDWRGYSLRQL